MARKSKPAATSYVRSLDGAVMVEIAPHVFVAAGAAERLGLVAMKAAA